MAYGHVGRPTNEEVAARKRKKLIKILLPTSLIAIVAIMIIGNNGLKGLMGAEVGGCRQECSDGWTLDPDNDKVCYQETSNTYLLGNANEDDKVTLEDYTIIKNAIESNTELDYVQKIVYDINGDGSVTAEDIEGFNSNSTVQASTVQTSTTGNAMSCPTDRTFETEIDGVQATVSVQYELNNDSCSVSINVRKETSSEKKCFGKTSTGASADEEETDDYEDSTPFGGEENQDMYYLQETEKDEDGNELEVYGEYMGNGQINWIDGQPSLIEEDPDENSDAIYSENGQTIDSYDETNDDSYGNDIDNEPDEYFEETIEEDDYDVDEYFDDDFSQLSRESNYLKYSADLDLNPSGGVDPIGYIYLQSINSRTKKSVQNTAHYKIYSSLNACKAGKNFEDFLLLKTNYNLKTEVVNSKTKKRTIKYKKLTYGIPIINDMKFTHYIKLDKNISGFTSKATECQKITSKYVDTIKKGSNGKVQRGEHVGYKKFTNRVKIKNDPISYKIGSTSKVSIVTTNADGTTKKSDLAAKTYKTVYYDDLTKVTVKTIKTGYAFGGWVLVRQDKNGKNNQTYCYTDKKNNKKAWKSKCDNDHKVILGTKGTTSFSRINTRANYTLILKPKWKSTNVTVKLKNGKKAFKKNAKVGLYTDKKCSKLKKSVSTKNGVANITKINTGTKYYIKATSSYSTGSSCVAVKLGKTTVTLTKSLKLPLNRYVIKYDSNGGKGTMSNSNVKRNVTVKLKTNKFSKSGKKFSYWTASKDKYKYCYINKAKTKKGWKTTCKYGTYHFKNNASIKNLASAGQIVTMKAAWK